jgi:hypothetical protein
MARRLTSIDQMEGKTIKSVTEGGNDMRQLLRLEFADGTEIELAYRAEGVGATVSRVRLSTNR